MVAKQLSELGIDTVAVCMRADLVGLADVDILEASTREGRVLVTENVGDFAALSNLWFAKGRAHAGIVMVGSKTVPHGRGKAGAIVRALVTMRDEGSLPARGQMVFLRAARKRE